MKNPIIKILIVLILPMAANSMCNAQEKPSLAKMELAVLKKSEQFRTYALVFRNVSKTSTDQGNELDSDVAADLSRIGEKTGDQLFAIDELMDVYAHLKCRSDRLSLKLLIEGKIKTDGATLNRSIKDLDLDLRFAKNSALTQSAARMRNDLKETMAFLNTISLQP